MPRILPWLLALILGFGWLFTAHPEWAPWRALDLDAGLGATPRERTLRTWAAAGFDSSGLGRAWATAGRRALDSAELRSLPFTELAYFGLGPRAFGYRFTVEAGRALVLRVDAELAEGQPFVELYRRELQRDTLAYRLVEAMPAGRDSLRLEVDEATTYVLRVEAPPLSDGRVRLTLGTDPQLGTFPVYGATPKNVKSVWGDSRGGGSRRHEGIDIFHPRGTPLVAARDGLVTRVRDRGLGGKQVWLQLPGKGLSLYYAHLDSQYVHPAQLVRAGDTLGTVGTTGNARTTPPHLHFGIYGAHGAIDPLPWVSSPAWPTRAAQPVDSAFVADGARTTGATEIYGAPAGELLFRLPAKQYVRPLAGGHGWTQVRLPDGRRGWVADKSLESLEQPLNETLPESPSEKGRLLYTAAFADLRYPGAFMDGATPLVLAQAGQWRLVATPARPRGWLHTRTPAGGS